MHTFNDIWCIYRGDIRSGMGPRRPLIARQHPLRDGNVATWRPFIPRQHSLHGGSVPTGRPLIPRQHPLRDGTVATWRPLIPRQHPLALKTSQTLTNAPLLKDAMPVPFRSELFTSYILTIIKQRNLLPEI